MSDRGDIAVILLAAMTKASSIMANAVTEVAEILMESEEAPDA